MNKLNESRISLIKVVHNLFMNKLNASRIPLIKVVHYIHDTKDNNYLIERILQVINLCYFEIIVSILLKGMYLPTLDLMKRKYNFL